MLSEAVLLSKLNHPNIIRTFNADVLELNSQRFGFFTMEYVAGGSLDQFWRSFGQRFIPAQTVVDILTQVCPGARRCPFARSSYRSQGHQAAEHPDWIRQRRSSSQNLRPWAREAGQSAYLNG